MKTFFLDEGKGEGEDQLWQYFYGTVIMAGWEASKRGPVFYMTFISSALTEWQGLFTVFKSFSIFQWLCEKVGWR